jgi:hypothetical protein
MEKPNSNLIYKTSQKPLCTKSIIIIIIIIIIVIIIIIISMLTFSFLYVCLFPYVLGKVMLYFFWIFTSSHLMASFHRQ